MCVALITLLLLSCYYLTPHVVAHSHTCSFCCLHLPKCYHHSQSDCSETACGIFCGFFVKDAINVLQIDTLLCSQSFLFLSDTLYVLKHTHTHAHTRGSYASSWRSDGTSRLHPQAILKAKFKHHTTGLAPPSCQPHRKWSDVTRAP